MKLYYVNYIKCENHYDSTNQIDYYDIKCIINDEECRMTFQCNNEIYIYEIMHYKENYIHKDQGPAIITYYENSGNIYMIEYYKNDKSHRIYGPSDIKYDKNGNIRSVRWYHKHKSYTSEVENWMKENKFNSWKDMNKDDFYQMWFEIL